MRLPGAPSLPARAGGSPRGRVWKTLRRGAGTERTSGARPRVRAPPLGAGTAAADSGSRVCSARRAPRVAEPREEPGGGLPRAADPGSAPAPARQACVLPAQRLELGPAAPRLLEGLATWGGSEFGVCKLALKRQRSGLGPCVLPAGRAVGVLSWPGRTGFLRALDSVEIQLLEKVHSLGFRSFFFLEDFIY